MRTITIGRDNSCDIIILNDRVSRRHATITPVNGGYVLRDMSNNGTLVNGIMVRNSERFIRFGEPVLLAGNIPFPWNRLQQGGFTSYPQPNKVVSQPYNNPQAYESGNVSYMDRPQMPVNMGRLPNMNMVMILSIISIVLGFTIIGTFIGIILAIIALILADKAQDTYLTNPNPTAWIDYPSLKRNMILAIAGFVVNGFWCAFTLDYGISSAIMQMNMNS